MDLLDKWVLQTGGTPTTFSINGGERIGLSLKGISKKPKKSCLRRSQPQPGCRTSERIIELMVN
jgi:hypothetical protein